MSVKVAIVGAGDVSNRYHLPLFRKIRQAEVVALGDTNREAVESAAKRWGIPATYTDFSELLKNQESGSIIDICTPPGSHLPFTAAAIGAGHHVLLEKPLAMSIDETEGIVNAYSERANKALKMGVCYTHIFDPVLAEMRRMSQECIGEVLGVEISRIFHPHEHMIADANHWCHKLPGGRFGEDLIHAMYELQYFIGDMKLESLWASKVTPRPWVAHDELYATFSAGKKFGKVYSSFNSVRPATYITVYGTEGTLWNEGITILHDSQWPESQFKRNIKAMERLVQSVKPILRGALRTVGFLPRPKTGREILMQSFVDSVLYDKAFPLTVQDACEANKTFLEVLQKLESG